MSDSVSVVICAFTAERLPYLDEAIESLRRQTLAPREIVVVVDHAPQLLAEWGGRWPGVRVIANDAAQGLAGARNSGVAAVDAEIVAFLDDDAVPAPDWIERLSAAYRDPAVVGAGGKVEPRWLDGRPGWFPTEFDWVVGCTHSGMPTRPEAVRNMVGANMSFRREPLIEVGGFREGLGRLGANGAGAEETDICIRVVRARPGTTILFDPAAKVEHVVPPARGKLSYFRRRCLAEGRSKAMLSGYVGSDSGLETERAYVRRTLPLGFLGGFRDALGGRPAGLGRSATMVYGLGVTSYGYLTGLRSRPPADELEAAAATDPAALRVLMVTPRSPLGQGGVERHVAEVSRRLAAGGSEVEVLCADPGGPALSSQEHDGVEIRAVRAWPADRDYYLAPGIWKQMGRRRWDIVHVQSYHTLVAPLAMLRALVLRVPYVVTFHGGGHSSALRNRSRGLQRLLLRPLLRRAARLVAVARFEIEDYGEELGLPPERFVLIPNGTELPEAKSAPRAEEGPPVLASIGRLERYKGHHRVIAAFPAFLRDRPGAKLLIVGTGPYEGALREQARELGIADAVEFTSVPAGDAAAMSELLATVSLVVLMSEFETHPLVALEAAASGRRLLVADAGGLAEIAADGLARPIPLDASPEEVARAAIEVLAEPPPSEVPDLISWDETARRLEELYREVAAS